MTHQRFRDGTEAAGGYARAVRAGNMVFVSGTTSLDPEGNVVGADVYAQTQATYAKIGAALERAGATWSDVTRITAFIADLGQADGFSRAHVEQFPGDEVPAAALIGTSGLLKPDLLIEIEATAVIAGEPA